MTVHACYAPNIKKLKVMGRIVGQLLVIHISIWLKAEPIKVHASSVQHIPRLKRIISHALMIAQIQKLQQMMEHVNPVHLIRVPNLKMVLNIVIYVLQILVLQSICWSIMEHAFQKLTVKEITLRMLTINVNTIRDCREIFLYLDSLRY